MMRSRYYCMGLVAAVGGSGWDTPQQVCLSASLSLCLSASLSLPTILTYSLATLQSGGGTYRADRATCDSRVRSQPGAYEAPLTAL